MNITKFFLENKILLTTMTLMLILFGINYYINAPRNEDPGFKIRTAVITSTLSGASARQIDKYVTHVIEEAAEQMDETEDIKSRSYNEKSVVYFNVWETYKNLQPIWDKLRRKIEIAKMKLPEGTNVIVDDEFGDVFGILLALWGKDFEYFELKDWSDKIKDELLKLENAAKVEVIGVQKEVLYIYYNNSTLARYNLTPDKLKNILKASNIIASGGEILVDDKYIMIETSDNYQNPKNIENTYISLSKEQGVIRLGDIVKVKKEYEDPPSTITSFNGQKAVILALSMKENGNILNFGKEVKKEMKRLQNFLPVGLNLEICAFQPDYVKYLTDKFSSSLLESIVIVTGVILFILGVKMGVITGFIIPLTIFGTFLFMNLFNIGLDKISLSALIIALGILVDNSIVISEGILKRIKHEGCNKLNECTIEVCRKYQTPLLVSALCTTLAFLPIYIADSTVSEYTSSLFKVVAITLLMSWFLSITVLPFLIELFFKNGIKNSFRELNISKYVGRFVKFALSRPKTTVFISVLLMVLSFFAFSFVPKIFFPDSDRPMFEVEFNLSEGADILTVQKMLTKTGEFLKNEKEVKNFSTYAGTSAPRYVLSASPKPIRSNFGMLLVNTKSYKSVSKLIKKVQNYCDNNFPDANTIVRKVPLGPPSDAPVEIRILGNSEEEVFKIVRDVQKHIASTDGVTLVKDDWGNKVAKIKVDIYEQNAARIGITNKDITTATSAATKGLTVSSYWRNTTNVPIVYRLTAKQREDAGDIGSIAIYSPLENRVFALSDTAMTKLVFDYPKIFRRNGFITVTVQAWINNNKTTAHKVISETLPYLKNINWPQGAYFEIGGNVENSKKGTSSVAKKIPVAFGIILLLMIGFFNSYKLPVIVLVCSVMALSGANFGLLITRSEFGFMTFLAYICLVGIATNNTLVLLDTIEKNKDGNNLELSVRKCARERITPVFLTALTTIGGMLPLWLGRDPMFSSLAVAIIFGLISSVSITLMTAPSLYILFSKSR